MEPLQIVDAHHHFWDLDRNYHPWLRDEPMIPFRYGDYSRIRRNYLPPDYLADSARFKILASVYIEAEWDPTDPIGETRWIHEIARHSRYPNAVVAQAWLDREDVGEVLATQAGFPLVRGIRHKPQASLSPEHASRGAPGSMDDPKWRDGYRLLADHGFSFDLQTPWWHFAAAADLARDFPNTLIIVNHTGLPADRSEAGLQAWREALQKLAKHSNVRLKISGLGVAGERWTAALNGSIVREAIAIFGVGRCMVGSNFPVDSVVATFDEIFDGFDAFTRAMSSDSRHRLFCANALETYRINLQATD
ncbi:MAG: amidohydrolase family protein [Burkholderiaceae bacterium]